jgi:hypothetical protein
MNSNVHQYPAALYSAVSEFGYRSERYTGEVLRSGSSNRANRANRGGHRRPRLRWLRPSRNGESSQPRDRQPARPAAAPHHYELKFHRGRHAH